MTKAFLIALGAVLAILALTALAWFFFGPADAKPIFDGMFGAIVGGLITAVVTLVLIFIGLQQVHQLANISNADFMLRRVDKFFQPETRKLIQLIEDSYLRFEERDPFRDSYFVPDEAKITSSGLHSDLKQSLMDEAGLFDLRNRRFDFGTVGRSRFSRSRQALVDLV
jgi:hypothetical protein